MTRLVRGTDQVILAVTLLLVVVGIAMVYSATFVSAPVRFGGEAYFLKRQVISALLGLGALLFGRMLDYHNLIRPWAAYGMLGLTGLLLVLTLLLGLDVNGARRWIPLFGLTFQPLELTKVSLVAFLAYAITVKRGRIRKFSTGLLPLLLIPGTLMALVLAQPDFGGTLLLAAVLFGMLFIGGARYLHLSLLSLAGAAGAVALAVAEPYRLERLLSFLHPCDDLADTGYQLCNSLVAFGRGGWLGVGLGQGVQKGFFVPELHTDFIMSNLAEETGLIGLVALLALYALLVLRMLRVSLHAGDDYGRLLACGAAVVVALQVVINGGVVMGLLPTKGLTLPLLSYGGSSLICTLFLIGVVLNVASHRSDIEERLESRQAHSLYAGRIEA